MGKFDGYLICTDLDDTLLDEDKIVSPQNKEAIEYFMREGGLFTFATGRMPKSAGVVARQIMPNAPVICANGASIYDLKEQKFLWSQFLDEEVIKAVEYIEKECEFAGIEVNDEETIYFSRSNRLTEECKVFEEITTPNIDYHLVKFPWKKVVFMVEAEDMPTIRQALANSEFATKYTFVQSSPYYYEILPPGLSKGAGIVELAKILGLDKNKTIGIGDNENDLDLVKKAGIGAAVANASQEVRDAADWIVADCNNHALKDLIERIEKELL